MNESLLFPKVVIETLWFKGLMSYETNFKLFHQALSKLKNKKERAKHAAGSIMLRLFFFKWNIFGKIVGIYESLPISGSFDFLPKGVCLEVQNKKGN